MKKATITPKVHIMPGRVTRGDTASSLSSLKHSGKFCFAALSYSFSCSAFGEVACVNISRKMCFFSYSNKYASILSYIFLLDLLSPGIHTVPYYNIFG